MYPWFFVVACGFARFASSFASNNRYDSHFGGNFAFKNGHPERLTIEQRVTNDRGVWSPVVPDKQ